MKLQLGANQLDIASIWVDRDNRQRQVFDPAKMAQLEASIKRRGLLNAILVSPREDPLQPWKLEAGECRLTACRNLGLSKILARKVSDLSPVESQIIELEENIKRSDLEWQDIVRATERIHQLYSQLDPDWSMGETADACSLSLATVSLYLSVAVEMREERVSKASTVREAYNMLQRRDQRRAGEALQELLETPDLPPAVLRADLSEEEQAEARALQELGSPLPKHLTVLPPPPPPRPLASPESILHTSFLDWAPTYSGQKFNLIHCDFPYGVELFSGPQGRGAELGQEGQLGYKDSTSTYQTLLASLCSNLDRLMSVSGHLMFWLSADFRIIAETVRYFNEHAPSLKFTKFPLIWVKSDNAGIASDPKHGPRHVYEACLLASRGARNIARVKGDAYSAPTDKRLHPSAKPEPMLRHFMEMLVDETTSLLDPTCGSGAALRAAESLGAKFVLGLEFDKQYLEPARLALKQARAKRAAEGRMEL